MHLLQRVTGPFFVAAGVMHFVIPGRTIALWARLPLQAVFAAWVLSAMRPRPSR